jgi:hypothetical protein
MNLLAKASVNRAGPRRSGKPGRCEDPELSSLVRMAYEDPPVPHAARGSRRPDPSARVPFGDGAVGCATSSVPESALNGTS